METVSAWFVRIREFLGIPILTIGQAQLTLWTLLYTVMFIVLLFYVSGKIRNWMAMRVLAGTKLDIGARQATASIIRYIVVVFGFLILLQTAGIDLTTLNVLAGAVGIGVGFGLQNIANNFISGVIILFERPIKVGDRIEVANVEGEVVHVGARSTTVVTNDNIAILVPNSRFISDNVINWSYTDQKVRFRIPVGVAYGSDTRLVEKLLLEVAAEDPNVLKDPPPAVRFMEFGDSALLFELRVWSSNLIHRKGKLISDLNFAVNEKLAQHGIAIPFPQRDIHIKSGSAGPLASGR